MKTQSYSNEYENQFINKNIFFRLKLTLLKSDIWLVKQVSITFNHNVDKLNKLEQNILSCISIIEWPSGKI